MREGYCSTGYISGLYVQSEVSCRLLKICIVWILLKTFPSGDMVLFACHDDRRLSSFSTKNTTILLDLTRLEMAEYMNR